MKTIKKSVSRIIIILSVFAISINSCTQESGSRDKDGNIKTEIRLRWVTQSQFAGVYWAKHRNIFEDNGLNVKINPGGPGINFLQVVATGAEKFGIAGAAQIIEARDKGLDVVALAIIFQKNPNIFFSKKKLGIKSPKDWTGKKIAVYYGFDIEYMYRALLKIHSVDPESVYEVPATVDMGPFFRDDVDVWAGYKINQPHHATESGYEIDLIDPDDYGLNVAGDVLFTTGKMIREERELVQKMVNSILDGWEQALNNEEEAVSIILSEDSNLRMEHEMNMMRTVRDIALPDDLDGKIGWMKKQQWIEMIRIWKEYGGIKNDIKPEDCFNNQFVYNYYNQD